MSKLDEFINLVGSKPAGERCDRCSARFWNNEGHHDDDGNILDEEYWDNERYRELAFFCQEVDPDRNCHNLVLHEDRSIWEADESSPTEESGDDEDG